MSLALLSGYSSAEDDGAEDDKYLYQNSSSDEADDHPHPPAAAAARNTDGSFSFVTPNVSNASGLPSALDAFSEVSGPPAFLNNSVEEDPSARAVDQPPVYAGRRRRRKDKKDVPSSAVVEAKAQLVGIHERVRSDVEGSQPAATVTSATQGGKRVATATNPKAEDAAELLRMCLQCGIPKTFSNARGMVCPVCSDRPPADNTQESKKKGSMIKDKEKNKRMKGQSSHATWKSETEMHLRQQFD